jgi:ABC-type branched-subunit amino acid transport system ATPase component
MVEQHARKAIRHADRVVVMRRGELVLSMSAEEALASITEVENAYLAGSPTTAATAADGGAAGA